MTNVAVAIIADNRGRLLLCQRAPQKPYPLEWEFPGGKVERGETAGAALRRELLEELGIDAIIGELFHRQDHTYPDSGRFDILYYTVRSIKGQISNRVFHDVRWVPIDELSRYDILEGNRIVIERLIADYAKMVAGKA